MTSLSRVVNAWIVSNRILRSIAMIAIVGREDGIDPEHEALLAESVGLALLVVLEKLEPAFVLHDMFAVLFDEIASIVGRSEAAARQLASRARRRVQGPAADLTGQRKVVDAFLAALRGGARPGCRGPSRER